MDQVIHPMGLVYIVTIVTVGAVTLHLIIEYFSKQQQTKENNMSNNILTEGNGFTTSYLPNQDSSILSWEDASQTETALLIKGEPMRILNGDWRELYAKCDGPKAAIKLYEAKKTEHASSYTEV